MVENLRGVLLQACWLLCTWPPSLWQPGAGCCTALPNFSPSLSPLSYPCYKSVELWQLKLENSSCSPSPRGEPQSCLLHRVADGRPSSWRSLLCVLGCSWTQAQRFSVVVGAALLFRRLLCFLIVTFKLLKADCCQSCLICRTSFRCISFLSTNDILLCCLSRRFLLSFFLSYLRRKDK